LAESHAAWTLESFTASDGYRWHYRKYKCKLPAERMPRARVVFLHGIQSHAGWYEYSCTALSEAGFEVYFLDRRGSGVNELSRGDAPSYQRLVDDIANFLAGFGPRRLREVPVFLVGISWGGKLAAALAIGEQGRRAGDDRLSPPADRGHPELIDGLVLLCPGFYPKVYPSLLERLKIGLTRLVCPWRYFPIPLNDPELFTASPKWQEFIRRDPLALHQATARLLVESARLDYYLSRVTPNMAPKETEVPVLLMLAGRDRIIDNAQTRERAKDIAKRVWTGRRLTQDLEIIEYPEASHTLEFEPVPDQFISDLIGWLEKHCGKPR
jgi:alpha-beta hydrolase superfamily lysophospholipase